MTTALHGSLRPWQPHELDAIHHASLRLLEATGVHVASDEVLDVLEATDAKVDRTSNTVRFPADMVEDRLRHAPGCWDRRPATVGQFSVTADCGCPMIWDYGLGRARPISRLFGPVSTAVSMSKGFSKEPSPQVKPPMPSSTHASSSPLYSVKK